MRQFFEEGDLLVAEVQSFFADGAMSLHTRSLTYGKVSRGRRSSVSKTHATAQLRNGQLVCVPPTLIRRLKSHFVSLPCNVDLILGLNGYIWVSKHIKQNRKPGEEGLDAESVYSNQNEVSTYPRKVHKLSYPISTFFKAIDGPTRMAISRVTNLIKVLASHFVPLSDVILLEAYEWAIENDVEVKDLTQPDVCEALLITIGTKG
jgi:exosome complex component RRP4